MNQKTKKQLTYWLSVAIIGIALGFGLQFVRAWTEPTTAPPNGNVGAPINTSSTAQTKAGGFTAETLTAATVKGTTQFCLGASCITAWPSGGGGGYVPPACECSINSGPEILDWYPCGTTVVTSYIICNYGWDNVITSCNSTCVARDVWMPESCSCYIW